MKANRTVRQRLFTSLLFCLCKTICRCDVSHLLSGSLCPAAWQLAGSKLRDVAQCTLAPPAAVMAKAKTKTATQSEIREAGSNSPAYSCFGVASQLRRSL